jgi:hypothetical protein
MDTIRFATSAICARIGVWLTSAISCSIRRSPARVVRMDRADSAGMASVPGLQQRHHLADVNLADAGADRGNYCTRAKSVCAPFRSCFLTSAHQRRWRRVRNRLVEPAVPGLMSLTGALPVTVPLVSHSSIPPRAFQNVRCATDRARLRPAVSPASHISPLAAGHNHIDLLLPHFEHTSRSFQSMTLVSSPYRCACSRGDFNSPLRSHAPARCGRRLSR